MKHLDCIRIKGIRVRGFHGIQPDESEHGREFSIDVAMYRDLAEAARSDELADTIDYTEVCRTVLEVCQGPSCRLMERLTYRIAQALLDAHPIHSVSVEVTKKPCGVDGFPEEFTVCMTRSREE